MHTVPSIHWFTTLFTCRPPNLRYPINIGWNPFCLRLFARWLYYCFKWLFELYRVYFYIYIPCLVYSNIFWCSIYSSLSILACVNIFLKSYWTIFIVVFVSIGSIFIIFWRQVICECFFISIPYWLTKAFYYYLALYLIISYLICLILYPIVFLELLLVVDQQFRSFVSQVDRFIPITVSI